ncbi:hypothetical protein GCM10023257_07610 [Streptomyces hyderabadensis]|uniref:Uncharacterized protein n=1 Tax=Streptomyces hyderabadensis TaxID=598549 RepID=A0ABP9HL84_9ACTN
MGAEGGRTGIGDDLTGHGGGTDTVGDGASRAAPWILGGGPAAIAPGTAYATP